MQVHFIWKGGECECRKNAGFTQEHAAELINVSIRSVDDYEAGKTIPKDDV
ncbi:helix-turn-helix domain-containing protein [Inediibacterium massiliense]|uniref:helix-turn-helix domain-containing protein n=1 Tax=Inediibacterium massiliense TaxID=1658111 RepID=UPI0018FE7185